MLNLAWGLPGNLYLSEKMLTRWLYPPLALTAGYFLYDMYTTGDNNLAFILPAALLLAGVYVLGPQINFWWSSRYPPQLEKPALGFLEKYHDFYRSLGTEQAAEFRRRLILIRMAKDFKSQAQDDMPEEVRLVYAANLAHLTFGLDEFLLPDYETVVVYPRPFPSPTYPKTFHASETFDEDGVLLFAARQLLNGFTQPEQFYNLCLHEQAVALMHSHPDWDWPTFGDDTWEHLSQISSFSREAITEWIGRPDVELTAVAIVHFLQFPRQMMTQMPGMYQQLSSVLANPFDRTS